MKIIIDQSELNKGLAIVGKMVNNRGQLPILSNVLISAEKEGVVLTATNLELGIRMEIGGRVEETGAVTVPARAITEFVGNLGDGQVELVTEGERMQVSRGKMKGKFMGMLASEFPVVPKGGAKSLKLDKKLIEIIANQVAIAAAVDESRPVLTGIKIIGDREKLEVIATDGFRMSRLVLENQELELTDSIILPAKTIQELARLVNDNAIGLGRGGRKAEIVEMEVATENNQVIFGYGRVQLVSRLLEGNFPDIKSVIPTEFRTEVTFDREEMLRAVRAMAIFARESSNVVKLLMVPQGDLAHGAGAHDKLTIRAIASQAGEAEAELEVEVTGEEGEIAFNFRYLLDYLQAVAGERVSLKMNGSLAPGVFVVEGDDNLVHLVMPVRV